ncbi:MULTISPECIES: protein phosphatase 2C domain-containing protein [unclassified Lysinibacillus]|uniref:PP2C family protein-serine/threonine phosphatase n=1 Tax=unclassified Lysinibacillus TaxID=2636778 RepID=UPI00103CB099|nr:MULTISPECIES: protein phosphatase 2C domain-containing protein [unclassified Lysinibacillus]MCM0627284.1 protein phosphatase 2C domain-containing protein [Lysinibacillus sp. OL1_EC]MCS5503775.1 protein phosphatase 2C domain-containing protein [Lysinibacillus sp. A4]TBV88567.1 serine/threonine-protein phosphatase [Lysinibacillus sp. OL1]UKJ43936.1 protein phosphatase 2C domain-containing protein [Lysinibacillus sp. ACHW1.5]WGT37876.1 protein phosphatase 2C domain-containing protein [Lysiniba
MDQNLVPYIIALIFIIILIVLLIIRFILAQKMDKGKIYIGNGQTIGRRDEQDDYFSTTETTHGTIAVLADGISGLANGRMASTIAVTTFIEEFKKLTTLKNLPNYFKEAAIASNHMILENLNGSNGGTTLVTAIIDKEGLLHWGAVGDSVIKIFRNGEFIAVNQKHIFESVLTERYISGEITQLEVQENPLKKRLINYLGYEGFKNLDIGKSPIQLNRGDKVCLFSDGVYDTLTEVEMEKILSQPTPPYDIAQDIIKAVEQKRLKNQDNATIVILEKTW